ncbi:hypothetical protein TVAG_292850 [Trichomonas vaginalis G3]|uniref:DNA polymerase delta small subunit n=1 Tax=Trichomonas vaginalis (strain ATCC PRA-98 / G3) TaxID=412133 RepID=A2EWX5_TRIV3|nr:DNA polymerase delta family [Trichomonas vaginalis G3]EAY02817.1 hypothetical protein TVAG_292850 [Trichomonas vaginalis G3]KAI5525647.1 DNA polymerase delta family [Trichomonas vaginalis G3]|eukprot:XP_001315040.1 hypothetical protein [Trichomonas vaginalis G3]
MEFSYDASRFHTKSNYTNRQFFNIYQDRLKQLRPLIESQVEGVLCKQLNQMEPDKPCTIIGVLYKNLSSRQNILDEYKDIGYESQAPEELTQSDKDTLFLEDESGRVQLVGLQNNEFVTGIVIGVQGVPSASTFEVTKVIYPQYNPPKKVDVKESHTIYFISDLAINHDKLTKHHMALAKTLNGADLVVYLGNNFLQVEQPDPEEMISFNERLKAMKPLPINKLESFFTVTKSKKIVVIPGQNDPCTNSLPQQPYHPVLLSSKKFVLASNPSKFTADGLLFLCDAGESPRDIMKTTRYTFSDAQFSILQWHHIAPTAPDQLPAVPVIEKDVLVMEDTPNVLVCGLAPEFEQNDYNDVKLISVPSFKDTQTIVAYDTKTNEAKPIQITV